MPKTPDEIKKGMEITSSDCLMCECCVTDCPYDLECHPGNEETNTNVPKAMLHDALALIQQLEARVPRWISVEERLPEAHADGYADAELVTDGEFIHMAYYTHGQWIFCESGEMKEPMWNKITHWMPLPEPPEESP